MSKEKSQKCGDYQSQDRITNKKCKKTKHPSINRNNSSSLKHVLETHKNKTKRLFNYQEKINQSKLVFQKRLKNLSKSKAQNTTQSTNNTIRRFKNNFSARNLILNVKKLKTTKMDRIVNNSIIEIPCDKLEVTESKFFDKLMKFTIEYERVMKLDNIYIDIEQYKDPLKEINKILNQKFDKDDQFKPNLNEIYGSVDLKLINDQLRQSISDCIFLSSKLTSKISSIIASHKISEQAIFDKIRPTISKLKSKFEKAIGRVKSDLKYYEAKTPPPATTLSRRQSYQVLNSHKILAEQDANTVSQPNPVPSKPYGERHKVIYAKLDLMENYTKGICGPKAAKKPLQNIPVSKIVLDADYTGLHSLDTSREYAFGALDMPEERTKNINLSVLSLNNETNPCEEYI